MARSQARIHTSIWHNEDFLSLSANAQRLYVLALSQDDVSFCGVVHYSATRWSRLARNTSIAIVTKGIIELCGALFAVLDEHTEELWIRTYLKHDGVLASPNLIRPMIRDFDAVHSRHIRDAITAYIRTNLGDGLPEGFPKPIRHAFQQRFLDPLPQPLPEGFPKPIRHAFQQRFLDPLPQPPPEGLPEPMAVGVRAHGAGPLASCLLPLTSSSSGIGSANGASPVASAEEEEDSIAKAVSLVAERKLANTTSKVNDRKAWLATVEAGIYRDLPDGWDDHGFTVEELVDLIDPPKQADPPKPSNPLDSTAAAAEAIYARIDALACGDCDGTGWASDGAGNSVARCETCGGSGRAR